MLDVVLTAGRFRRPPSPETLRADPLGYLADEARSQRALADLLEAIADSLPDGVNRATAARAAALLRGPAACEATVAETALAPLVDGAGSDDFARRVAEILRREHGEAAGRAIELAEELDALARSGRVRNPESLGFMLRAFFDAQRRNLDWIEAAVLSPARASLEAAQLAVVGARLAALAERAALPDWSALGVIEGGAAG